MHDIKRQKLGPFSQLMPHCCILLNQGVELSFLTFALLLTLVLFLQRLGGSPVYPILIDMSMAVHLDRLVCLRQMESLILTDGQ